MRCPYCSAKTVTKVSPVVQVNGSVQAAPGEEYEDCAICGGIVLNLKTTERIVAGALGTKMAVQDDPNGATKKQKEYCIILMRKKMFWEHAKKDPSDAILVFEIERRFKVNMETMTKADASRVINALKGALDPTHTKNHSWWQ